MKTVVIHRKEDTHRVKAIESLRTFIPDLQVIEAKVPAWEDNKSSRSVRGCALSHLSAVRAYCHREPLLVLEDDAVIDADAFKALRENKSFNIPRDAAAILLGSEAAFYGDELKGGMREVLPPFFGTQAVLYLPQHSEFLLSAFHGLSSLKVGTARGSVCYESIMAMAANDSKTRIYRPHEMCFTTTGGVSDTFEDSQAPRRKAWKCQEHDGLLPISTWDCVFSPHQGKRAHLLPVAGNVGDAMLYAATLQMLAHHKIKPASLDEAEVVFYPAGGNVSGQNPTIVNYGLRNCKATKVILPQTLHDQSDYVDSADEVWVRDTASQRFSTKAKFAPDLALGYRSSLQIKPSKDSGLFFRIDEEKTKVPKNNISDPAKICKNHYEYLKRAATFRQIHTNRLHFAIAGLIKGREVTLYDNKYHKCHSVYKTSLQHLGCKWGGSEYGAS
jgi:hypothetical protein